MSRLVIILCITYPLLIATEPNVMRLTTALCIIGTAQIVEQAVYDLDAQGNYQSKGDSSHNITLKKCTFDHQHGFTTIEYSIPMGGTKLTIVNIPIMFGMENIVNEYPADHSKYIRISLVPITETTPPRIVKHVSFASLPIKEDSSLVTQD
jgi:hypothetical protein